MSPHHSPLSSYIRSKRYSGWVIIFAVRLDEASLVDGEADAVQVKCGLEVRAGAEVSLLNFM